MTGSTGHGMRAALFALLALAGSQAHAQPAASEANVQAPAYRCSSRGKVTYSQIACPGGRPVGATAHRVTDKSRPPPQDRAIAAKRARLTPQERQECRALDRQLVAEEKVVRSKGEAVTIEDEMPLVRAKKRFRELKC